MIITKEGQIHFLTVGEHLQRKSVIYQDPECTVYLRTYKSTPFIVDKGRGNSTYIDVFALRFGQKEQLRRRMSKGSTPIQYRCKRSTRDAMLFLPVEDVINTVAEHNCPHRDCQYWSPPTGVKSQYAFNCILARYRALNYIDLKSGLTLEEVSRIYGCTRERIRQIEEKAIERMRHRTRSSRLAVFRERIYDYRELSSGMLEKIA